MHTKWKSLFMCAQKFTIILFLDPSHTLNPFISLSLYTGLVFSIYLHYATNATRKMEQTFETNEKETTTMEREFLRNNINSYMAHLRKFIMLVQKSVDFVLNLYLVNVLLLLLSLIIISCEKKIDGAFAAYASSSCIHNVVEIDTQQMFRPSFFA